MVQLHCDIKNHDKILSKSSNIMKKSVQQTFQFKYSQKVFHMIRQYVWWFWTNHQTVCKIISNVRWADGFSWTLGWAWLWRLGLGISWRYIPIRDSKLFTSLWVLGTHGPWSLWVPEHWETDKPPQPRTHAGSLMSQIVENTKIDEHLGLKNCQKSNSRTPALRYICCNK